MSTATIQLSDRTALQFDTIQGIFAHSRTGPGVLVTIQRPAPEDLLSNLAFIPADKLGAVIASLELIRKQLQGRVGGLPTPHVCRVAP